MRSAGYMRVCGATIFAVAMLARPAVCQPRSAAIRVSAQVIDVAALAPMPRDPVDAAASRAVTGAAPSGRLFSVVPPRHSAIAVSMHVRGAPAGNRGAMAIQVCRSPAGSSARCRRVPFADSAEGFQAHADANEPVVLRLLGVADLEADTTQVMITLAYPAN